jgi:hypothetical protein
VGRRAAAPPCPERPAVALTSLNFPAPSFWKRASAVSLPRTTSRSPSWSASTKAAVAAATPAAGSPAAAVRSREPAAVVVQESDAGRAQHQKVGLLVVVVVAGDDTRARDIGREAPIGVGGDETRGPVLIDALTVGTGDEKIEPAVAVEIREDDAARRGASDGARGRRGRRRDPLGGDIDEAGGRRRAVDEFGLGAGGDDGLGVSSLVRVALPNGVPYPPSRSCRNRSMAAWLSSARPARARARPRL